MIGRLLCWLNVHAERDQHPVGRCPRCGDVRMVFIGRGYWLKYVQPPDAADRPKGLPR